MRNYLNTYQYGKIEILTEAQLKSFHYVPEKRKDLDLLEDSEGNTYEIYEHIQTKRIYCLEI